MTLDLARVIGDMRELVLAVDGEADRGRFNTLRAAWETLDSAEANRRMADGRARITFLLPHSRGDYRARQSLPPCPPSYAVVGSDGSCILPDRHSPARFYLLNIGTVLLCYGARPSARLDAVPMLFYEDKDLFVPGDLRRAPVTQEIVGLRRAAAELDAARALLAELREPGVALQDGTLILWPLEAASESVKKWVLDDFLRALAAFRDSGTPVASYISAPGSAELVNLLRVAVCDYPPAAINCDACRARIATEGRMPACDALPGVTDRYLLAEIALLKPGERTQVYASRSKVLERYQVDDSDDLKICYFYLNVGHEIGRVEIPRWVAEDVDQLNLVHAVVYDQCRRGRGYPAVLQEAHEQAVLSTGDRALVEQAIERLLAEAGVVMTLTGKGGSKRVRYV